MQLSTIFTKHEQVVSPITLEFMFSVHYLNCGVVIRPFLPPTIIYNVRKCLTHLVFIKSYTRREKEKMRKKVYYSVLVCFWLAILLVVVLLRLLPGWFLIRLAVN